MTCRPIWIALAVSFSVTGCSYMSERFGQEPSAQPRPKPSGYTYSNPSRPRALSRRDDVTTEAMPGPRRKVTDPVALMECRTDWCVRNCDPEVMPKPKACVFYKPPRDVDVQGNAAPPDSNQAREPSTGTDVD